MSNLTTLLQHIPIIYKAMARWFLTTMQIISEKWNYFYYIHRKLWSMQQSQFLIQCMIIAHTKVNAFKRISLSRLIYSFHVLIHIAANIHKRHDGWLRVSSLLPIVPYLKFLVKRFDIYVIVLFSFLIDSDRKRIKIF